MTYDYFLYDNRTLGPGGYEWGVKLATGRLRDDGAVKEKFVEYCRDTFDSRRGPLSNFGAALGGIRLTGGAYLLCVTLEVQDLHQRPSCAFVGIYCPQLGSLKTILTQGDPIASAERISNGSRSNLALEGNPLVATDQLATYDVQFGRSPFTPGSTPQKAAAVLLKFVDKGGRLPSILGIAQWSPARIQILKGYDLAYCPGLPANAIETRRAVGPDSNDGPKPGFFKSTAGLSILGIVLCAAVAAFIWGPLVFRSSTSDPKTALTPTPSPSPAGSPSPTSEPADASSVTTTQPVAPSDDPEAFLQRLDSLVKRFESAPPLGLLENTSEWKTLKTVPVSSHQSERERMIALFKTGLPEFQRAVHEENFEYYLLEAKNHKRDPADVVKSVRGKLRNLHLPIDECKLLRDSFSLWTESPQSATGQWCKLVDDFAKVISQSNSER